MLAPIESYCTEFFGAEKLAALNAIKPRLGTLDESVTFLRSAMEKFLAFSLPKSRTIGVLVGGVDGALIVSLVKQFGLEPVVCTTGTAKSDDIQSAKSLSEVFGTPFIPVMLDGVDLNPRLRVAIERLQYCGLFSITSAILLDFCLEKCASAGIEYLLTGNGGPSTMCRRTRSWLSDITLHYFPKLVLTESGLKTLFSVCSHTMWFHSHVS